MGEIGTIVSRAASVGCAEHVCIAVALREGEDPGAEAGDPLVLRGIGAEIPTQAGATGAHAADVYVGAGVDGAGLDHLTGRDAGDGAGHRDFSLSSILQ